MSLYFYHKKFRYLYYFQNGSVFFLLKDVMNSFEKNEIIVDSKLTEKE